MAKSSSSLKPVHIQRSRVHGPKMLKSKALPTTTHGSHGHRDPWMNPNFIVKGQQVPTAAEPIKRRKQMGGMHGSFGFHTK